MSLGSDFNTSNQEIVFFFGTQIYMGLKVIPNTRVTGTMVPRFRITISKVKYREIGTWNKRGIFTQSSL